MVTKYSQNDPKKYIVSSNVLNSIKTKTNQLWVATDKGITIISKDKTTSIQHNEGNNLSLKSNIAVVLHSDKNNNIWIGTNQGISVFKNSLNKKVERKTYTSDAGQNVANIAFENNDMYVASYLDKTYKINLQNDVQQPLIDTPGAGVLKILMKKFTSMVRVKRLLYTTQKPIIIPEMIF